jgi:hypothetical protein
MRSWTVIAVLGVSAVLSLTSAPPVGAVPFLSAAAGEGGAGATELQPCNPAGGVFTSGGAPVSSHAVCGPTFFGEGSALAIASIGSVGAEARARHIGFGTAVSMESVGIYSDTVVFSGPGVAPIPVGVNVHLAGSLNSDPGGFAGVIARILFNGAPVGVVRVNSFGGVMDCTGTTFTGLPSCGATYNATLVSSPVLVPQDTPILVQLDIDASAAGGGNGSSGVSSFSDTFGFVAGQLVFDLPAGFTANSPTSFIVDNRFVPVAAAAAVPESSSLLLVMSALGLLAILRRRRV